MKVLDCPALRVRPVINRAFHAAKQLGGDDVRAAQGAPTESDSACLHVSCARWQAA